MRGTILALAAALAATPSPAADDADVTAVVKQYNDAFNTADAKTLAALCAPQAIIIDDFAPHAWQGANACAEWYAALLASDKAAGISSEFVMRGRAWHISVTGERAYAVYPTRYTYKLNGKPVAERGTWTFALRKLAGQWRIQGWAWAQQ